MSPLPPLVRSAATSLVLALPVAAQCANVFLPTPAAPVSGRVFAAVPWDPDGTGPQPPGLVVGGDFLSIGGQTFLKVALYHPASDTWTALPGLPSLGEVRALAVLPDGSLVAGGTFSGSVSRLARWTGTTWTTIGGGVTGGGGVLSLLVEPNGDLLVGGTFSTAGAIPATGIARWNGTAWSALPGLQSTSPLGIGVFALAHATNGDLFAAGLFGLPGGWNVARWNGSNWTPVWTGASSQLAMSLLALPNGHMLVGLGSGIQVWNGAGLQFVVSTNADIRAMRHLPDGDILVAGQFDQLNLQPLAHLARWNGTTWTPVAGGTSSSVFTMAPLPNGDLLVAGDAVRMLSSNCPATVAAYGAGCTGSGGPNTLTATTLPWLGSTFRARATGMPASALVLSAYGLTQLAVPMPAILAQGQPGCSAWTSGESLELLVPNAGTVDTALAVPDAAILVGATFHHYVVPFEFDAAMQLLAVTSTNAVTCTLGAF